MHWTMWDFVALCGSMWSYTAGKSEVPPSDLPSAFHQAQLWTMWMKKGFHGHKNNNYLAFSIILFFFFFFFICIQPSNCGPCEWRRFSINIRVSMAIIMVWGDIIRVFRFWPVFSCLSSCVLIEKHTMLPFLSRELCAIKIWISDSFDWLGDGWEVLIGEQIVEIVVIVVEKGGEEEKFRRWEPVEWFKMVENE